MNIHNLDNHLIWCHICNEPRKYGIQTYFYGEDVRCLICDADNDKGAHLGFEWDIPQKWRNKEISHIEIFYNLFDIEKKERIY